MAQLDEVSRENSIGGGSPSLGVTEI